MQTVEATIKRPTLKHDGAQKNPHSKQAKSLSIASHSNNLFKTIGSCHGSFLKNRLSTFLSITCCHGVGWASTSMSGSYIK